MPTPLNLNIDAQRNVALNNDGVSVLRTWPLVQGNIYQVDLNFYQSGAPFIPEINDFAFYLRQGNNSSNLIAASALASGASGYYFSLDAASPAVGIALGKAHKLLLKGLVSWVEGTTIEIVEPFNVQLFNSYSGNASNPITYVSSVNNLSGAVLLTGDGSVTIAQSGQTLTFSAPAPDLTGYALASDLQATGATLSAEIATLQTQTGDYYQASNPSGFITGVNLSPYATTATVSGATGVLEAQISAINSFTGTLGTAAFTASSAYDPYGVAASVSGALQAEINTLNSETGTFYLNSNPSGFITGVNLSSYALEATLTGASGMLQGEINNLTSQTGNYYQSGSNIYGTFYGNGANLTGIAGGGGGAATSVSGSVVATSLDIPYSTTSTSLTWNPAATPFLSVTASNGIITLTGTVTSGAMGIVKNNTLGQILLSGSNISVGPGTMNVALPLLAGNALTFEGIGSSWCAVGSNNYPRSIASNVLTSQTAAATVLTATGIYDGLAVHTYQVSPWMTVASRTTDVIAMQLTWKDETSTIRTQAFYPMGATVSGVSSVGFVPYSPITILGLQANTIVVSTTLPTAGGSISYDAGATVIQLS